MNFNANTRKLFFSFFGAILILLQACNTTSDNDNYYSSDDFSKVKKIDVHAHALTARPDLVQQAKDDNFILVSLNTEVPGEPPIDSEQYYALQLHHNFPNDIFYVTTFETATINQPGWSDRQLAYLKRSFDSGAIGIKVWKNIGMTIKDKDSNFIMIDD
ncbi:MAG TPA: hypothetical protein VN958_01430, partial [Chitinophagaceae bacterium]|nr:hypothetical protein [Chitinophagaceae bacterium]